MHNFSPTSPVLGDSLQLFPAQSRLRDVCLKVTSPCVFRSPPLSLALRVPRQACLVILVFGFLNVWPSHPHLLLIISISIRTWFFLSQILVADFVHPQYSQYFQQALIYKSLDPFQCGLVHSPRFCNRIATQT